MKKSIILITMFSSLFLLSNIRADAEPNYKKEIVGTWQYNIADGNKVLKNNPTIEHKANGTFIQKMGNNTFTGKYTIKGNKLTYTMGKQTSVYIFQSINGKILTYKSEPGGKITELEKK
jgi:heat shock protein HslJ